MAVRILPHPGRILKNEFLNPMGLTQNQLADAIGVPAGRISQIVNEKRDITPDTAARLAKFFGTSDKFWMNLQTNHGLSKVQAENHDILREIQRHFHIQENNQNA